MGFRFKTALAAACTSTILTTSVMAGEFRIDRLIVLGDSLSDGGAYSQSAIAQSGGLLPNDRYRFTDDTVPAVDAATGGSKVYAEHLADQLGLTLDPNIINGVPAAGPSPLANDNNVGGFNFAQGGSRVSDPDGVGNNPAFGITTIPVTTQVDRLLAASPTINSTDLVIVWAGANDVFKQAEANGPALVGGTPAQMAAAQQAAFGGITQAATDLVGQVDRLRAAGAQNLVVVTVPDIGRNTPDGASSGPAQPLLSGLTTQFNDTLIAGVAGNATIVNANSVLEDVLANPARYGFDNIALNTEASKACPASSLGCVQGVSDKPDGLNQVYADGVHPSAAAHFVLARIAGAGLVAVTQNGVIPVATLSALRQQSIGLETRLNLGAMFTRDEAGTRIRRPVGDVEVYGGAELGVYKSDDQQVLPGFDASTQVVKAAVDVAVADGVVLGAGVSLDHGQVNFTQDRGGFDSRLIVGAVFGVAEITRGVYVNGVLGGGYIDVHDVNRSFAAGPARESYSGDTDGTYFVAKTGLGAMLPIGQSGFVINPSVGLTFERVSIGGYTEEADGGSGLGARNSYGDIDYEGHRATAALAGFYRPPAADSWTFGLRASWEHDFNNDDVEVTYGARNDGGPSLLQTDSAPRPDGSYGFLSGSVTKEFGVSSSLTLQGSTVIAQDGVDGFTGSLLYKMSF